MRLDFDGAMAHAFNAEEWTNTENDHVRRALRIRFKSGHSLELTHDEAQELGAIFYEGGHFFPDDRDDDDDDLDAMAERDQIVWDVRETAKDALAVMLRQSDMASVMNDDAFATAIAERAVFLAKAMHAKVAAPAATSLAANLDWILRSGPWQVSVLEKAAGGFWVGAVGAGRENAGAEIEVDADTIEAGLRMLRERMTARI